MRRHVDQLHVFYRQIPRVQQPIDAFVSLCRLLGIFLRDARIYCSAINDFDINSLLSQFYLPVGNK